MEAWMAFVSIMAIVAIVLVGGGLIAFIAHMIIGAFDNNKNTQKTATKEVIDYAQYKQLENSKQVEKVAEKDYDFDAINEAKAEKEQAEAEKAEEVVTFDDDEDDEIEAIEERLKQAAKTEDEKIETKESEEDVEDFDFDQMLEDISKDVIEEEKENSDNEPKMSEELENYNIDDILNAEETEEIDEVEETTEEVAEETEEIDEVEETTEEVAEETEEIVEPVEEVESPVETVVEDKSAELDSANAEILKLKAELEELNKQLEAAKSSKTEVVTIDMTEEECVARLETLEERLKAVKKDYKVNAKEYRPLKKVMNDLERYQTKLRRKETVVAKKKVALYGVNNYVDIDKEKAEKLANEIELYEGLRLSVAHCEEVINANKDRFPILEHTNQILEDQIAHIEADIAATQATLEKIRDKKGNGENAGDSDANGDAENI